MKRLILLPLLLLLTSCAASPPELDAPAGAGGGARSASTPPMAYTGSLPQVINVSAYDPKERQRPGQAYTQNDLSALRENGAMGLIARAGKGGVLDTKCANFLAAADRVNLLPGVYYRLQNHVDAVAQADQYVDRIQALAASRSWNAPALLICSDFDAQSRMSDITRFMDRVEARTGVVPVTYLENSTHLKKLLSRADAGTKAKLRRSPYWLALYAHDSGAGPEYPAPGDPAGLVAQYQVWPSWSLWQYGGVVWEGGRSRPKVYHHGRYRFPLYFGNLDRPVERNVFNGSPAALQAFWRQHGLPLK